MKLPIFVHPLVWWALVAVMIPCLILVFKWRKEPESDERDKKFTLLAYPLLGIAFICVALAVLSSSFWL
jgi:hypothetical protein